MLQASKACFRHLCKRKVVWRHKSPLTCANVKFSGVTNRPSPPGTTPTSLSSAKGTSMTGIFGVGVRVRLPLELLQKPPNVQWRSNRQLKPARGGARFRLLWAISSVDECRHEVETLRDRDAQSVGIRSRHSEFEWRWCGFCALQDTFDRWTGLVPVLACTHAPPAIGTQRTSSTHTVPFGAGPPTQFGWPPAHVPLK